MFHLWMTSTMLQNKKLQNPQQKVRLLLPTYLGQMREDNTVGRRPWDEGKRGLKMRALSQVQAAAFSESLGDTAEIYENI